MWRLYPAQFIPLYFLFPATALAVTLPPNIPRDTPTEVAKIVVESPRLPTPEEPVPVADDGRFLIPPPNPGTDIGLMGQDHAYTVTFRGNGESVVSLRIAFSNTGTKTMEALAIRVPRITPQDIVAFQIKREPQCIRYMPYRYDPSNPYDNPQCAEYRKPDYFEPWWDTATYFRSETILKGDKIIIDLPNPVAPNESGSVIVYYRGTGYATRNWTGGWNYVFETATVSDPVRKLTVGIQTDGDQVLKGANGGVNYATESIAGNPVVTLDSVGGKSAQLDRVAQQIGQGSVVKQAFDLQPNESYTVRGAFAATMVQLYSTELAVFLLILGIGFMGGFILIRILTKQYVRRFLITRKNSFPIQNMLVAILAGSGSALVIVLYTVLAGIFYYLFSINLYGHALTMFLGLCLFIVSAGVYLFFFTVPALVVGIRKGLWTGVVTAFITLSILVGISIIILVFTLLFRAPPQDYPLYRMSSDEAPAVDMTK